MSRRVFSPRSDGATSKYDALSCVSTVGLPAASRLNRKNSASGPTAIV